MAEVKLTMFADPVEVPDDDVAVLQGQGLIADPGPSPAEEAAAEYAAAVRQAADERAAAAAASGGKTVKTPSGKQQSDG